MTTVRHIARAAAPRRARIAVLGVTALAISATACDLKVAQPDVASAASVNLPAARLTLLNGAVSLFSAGYAGNGDSSGVASLGGLLADEFTNSDYQDRHIDVDQRNVPETSTAVAGAFAELQRARVASLDIAGRYATAEPNSIHGAEAEMIAGYTFLTFAENWCNGVPYSSYNGGATIYGTPTTSVQSYDSALVHFDKAIAIAVRADTANTDNADVVHTAMVGKGRTLLGLGQYAAAASAVAAVKDPSFVYYLYTSSASSKQYNGVYSWNNSYGRFTAANNEAGEGLDFLSANDPRVKYQDAGKFGLDARTELIYQEKYPNYDSPVPLASYTEAELIRAEAELQANNANWLTRLNALRADVGLGPLADPDVGGAGATKPRVALLFRERAFWLWLTGHRMADLRRMLRQYGTMFTQSEIYPTGTYPKGGVYGTDVVFKVPFDERNNPNYSGKANTCTDFNP